MKWITIPEGPSYTITATPSILIFRNISFLSTEEFYIYNQATRAWNKTIQSVLHPSFPPPPPSTNFSLLIKPWVWVLNCPCPPLSSDSYRPVVNLGKHSKQKKNQNFEKVNIPPPTQIGKCLIWFWTHLCISCPPQLKMKNTWNWYFSDMFYLPSSVPSGNFNCNWSL